MYLNRVSDYCKPILAAQLKDKHDGRSESARKFYEDEESSIFKHAPTVILVAGRTKNRFRMIDCSLCAENMMLAAHEMGIGSCVIGGTEVAFEHEELMAGFRIPEGYSPIGTIAFGYPAETPEFPGRNPPAVTWVR